MSDATPPYVFGESFRSAQETLGNETIETVLADFRSWLQEKPAPSAEELAAFRQSDSLDLHTLLGLFIGLRQEINLQTKANRSQLTQNNTILEKLSQSLDLLQEKEEEIRDTDPEEVVEEALRPLLKTLIDLYDILSLGERQVSRVDDTLLPALEELKEISPSQPAQTHQPQSKSPSHSQSEQEHRSFFWSGLFGMRRHKTPQNQSAEREPHPDDFSEEESDQAVFNQHEEKIDQIVDRIRQLVQSIVTGYSMSVQRIDRTLEQQDLEPIPTVGEPFDPETMEVADVVFEPGRETTEVIQEVRRGYFWKGRVFRYAQVKVARPEIESTEG